MRAEVYAPDGIVAAVKNCHLYIVGKIHHGGERAVFHYRPIPPGQGKRLNVHCVGEEIARRIGETDHGLPIRR